jgi:WD40 repeat protein
VRGRGFTREFTSQGIEMIIWQAQERALANLHFTTDGQYLLTSGDHAVRLWDLANRTDVRRWPGSGPETPLAVSANGQFIARGGDGLRICPIDRQKSVRTCRGRLDVNRSDRDRFHSSGQSTATFSDCCWEGWLYHLQLATSWHLVRLNFAQSVGRYRFPRNFDRCHHTR